jgi:hypothetical protein
LDLQLMFAPLALQRGSLANSGVKIMDQRPSRRAVERMIRLSAHSKSATYIGAIGRES